MKQKFTFLFLMVLFSFSINAQSLINWSIASPDVTIEQEAGAPYVTEGTYAAKCTWTSTSNQDVYSDVFTVTGDAAYTYTLDVFDNDPGGRVRMVIAWGASNSYSDVYSVDDANVQTLTMTGTVPTGETTAQIKLRFYDVSGGWTGSATVWVDNANYNEGGANLIPDGGFENWLYSPTISNIAINPLVATNADAVTVSADITDNGSITSAVVNYGFSTGTYDQTPINMTLGTAPNYVADSDIPAQATGTTVYYVVVATDDDTNVTTSDEMSYTVIDPPSTYTISQIQTPTDIGVSDESPLLDDYVETSGVVTAVDPSGYFIQDAEGAWNGIYVLDYNNTVAIGDSITIAGLVSEYYNLTELKDIFQFAVNSTGNTPVTAVVTTADAAKEDYESVLLQVRGATCTNEDAGYGMWTVDDGSGEILIDDVMYSYTPALNVKYNVTGLGFYSYSEVKILPRDAADIQDATSINTLGSKISIYPNPSNGIFNINFKDTYNLEVMNIAGKIIDSRNLTGNSRIELKTSGLYFIKISNKEGSYIQKVIVQ